MTRNIVEISRLVPDPVLKMKIIPNKYLTLNVRTYVNIHKGCILEFHIKENERAYFKIIEKEIDDCCFWDQKSILLSKNLLPS